MRNSSIIDTAINSIDGGIFLSKLKYLKEGIKITSKLINNIMFLYDVRTKDVYFTRKGTCKKGFKNMILFMINFVKKSLQIELDNFAKIKPENNKITKQAFSQARNKISPKAFIYLLDEVNKWFYKQTIMI